MPALRSCPVVGCPELTASGRCAEHRREADRARGTRQQRGYDLTHTRTRTRLIRAATSATPCARCRQPLGPDYRAAHLDHTDDRQGWIGLSHPTCNTSAGGRAARGKC